MKYTVKWIGVKDNKDVEETFGTYNTLNEAVESIRDWWKLNNFNPYYTRHWKQNNIYVIDYGCHSCFYHIVEE